MKRRGELRIKLLETRKNPKPLNPKPYRLQHSGLPLVGGAATMQCVRADGGVHRNIVPASVVLRLYL